MANTLSELRKNSSIDQLIKAAEGTKKVYENNSPEIWGVKGDSAGNASAVIRFMPAPKGESVPWAKLFSHGFQDKNTGRWYIENSLTTIGQVDPVTEANNALYATKDPENIKIAKDRKRKLNYYANVLIVKDPANPENEGKVVLFRFGQKIFDKIMLAMKPDNTGLDPEDWVEPFDPFSAFEGRNFNLKMKRIGPPGQQYANFDDSNFSTKSKPLAETDEDIDSLWAQCKSLSAITSPDKFKSYEALKKRFDFVTGGGASNNTSTASDIADSIAENLVEEDKVVANLDSSGDDDLDYFRKLAAED